MQRNFNRSLDGFRRALENTNLGQRQDPYNINFNLNMFVETAFENSSTEDVMNQNDLVRLARKGGHAYPNQRRNIMTNSNRFNRLPYNLQVGFAEDMMDNRDKVVKTKLYKNLINNPYANNAATLRLLNALSRGVGNTNLNRLKKHVVEKQDLNNALRQRAVRSLNGMIGANTRRNVAAKAANVVRMRTATPYLIRGGLPPNTIDGIRKAV